MGIDIKCFGCGLHVHWVWFTCTLGVVYMYIGCGLHVHWVWFTCTLGVVYMYIESDSVYSLFICYIFP